MPDFLDIGHRQPKIQSSGVGSYLSSAQSEKAGWNLAHTIGSLTYSAVGAVTTELPTPLTIGSVQSRAL